MLAGSISRIKRCIHCVSHPVGARVAPLLTGSGMDPARPACRKKKEMRRERWRQKHGQTPDQKPASALAGAELEDLLAPSPDAVHKLEVRHRGAGFRPGGFPEGSGVFISLNSSLLFGISRDVAR